MTYRLMCWNMLTGLGGKRNMDTECSKIITKIKENYASLEKGIVNQLYFEAEHGATIGHYREKIWAEMFKRIVPKKFVVEQSVFLIDSRGKVSNEVDLAIFDELYTPYIFRYYDLKFIPLEAVAVVVECKSTSLNKENLESWAESISELKTSSAQKSFARTIRAITSGPADTQDHQRKHSRTFKPQAGGTLRADPPGRGRAELQAGTTGAGRRTGSGETQESRIHAGLYRRRFRRRHLRCHSQRLLRRTGKHSGRYGFHPEPAGRLLPF